MTPLSNSSPVRCCCVVGLNVIEGSLSAVPASVTGKLGRSWPVAMSSAPSFQTALPFTTDLNDT